MKNVLALLTFLSIMPVFAPAYVVDVVPRISNREIIESLAELKAGQQAINTRIDDLPASTNRRFDDMNKRFDTLQWMLGLFMTIALFILGAMGRILWSHQ